jgi:hypothetical protein
MICTRLTPYVLDVDLRAGVQNQFDSVIPAGNQVRSLSSYGPKTGSG